MGRYYKQLNHRERLKIEYLLQNHVPIKEIALSLGKHPSTIYREIKRGLYSHTLTDLTEELRYASDRSEQRREDWIKKKRGRTKVKKSSKLMKYLKRKLVKGRYSPKAIASELKGNTKRFGLTVCTRTIYNYIEHGVIPGVTLRDLPYQPKKRKYYRIHRQKKLPKGNMIEQRADEINLRTTFGHWEMDTVEGNKKSKKCLLVLTERLTRKELIYLMKEKTTEEVVKVLNRIERKLGTLRFRKLFKSITMDNGAEFSDIEGIEKTKRTGIPRTKAYYCKAYAPYQRGSNENANKLIRRFYPKGISFDEIPEAKIMELAYRINYYPREIFNFNHAQSRFNDELKKLGMIKNII